jgi:hypothetical protein
MENDPNEADEYETDSFYPQGRELEYWDTPKKEQPTDPRITPEELRLL